jgi:hypothetical protein
VAAVAFSRGKVQHHSHKPRREDSLERVKKRGMHARSLDDGVPPARYAVSNPGQVRPFHVAEDIFVSLRSLGLATAEVAHVSHSNVGLRFHIQCNIAAGGIQKLDAVTAGGFVCPILHTWPCLEGAATVVTGVVRCPYPTNEVSSFGRCQMTGRCGCIEAAKMERRRW